MTKTSTQGLYERTSLKLINKHQQTGKRTAIYVNLLISQQDNVAQTCNFIVGIKMVSYICFIQFSILDRNLFRQEARYRQEVLSYSLPLYYIYIYKSDK